MTLSVGDKIPEIDLHMMSDNQITKISTSEIFDGKKVVLFAVPGAYTPTCSNAHLPGYVVKSKEFFDNGVDKIACLSVNDPFVMDSWGKNQNAEDILMLADGNAEFTKAVGIKLDLTEIGLGLRSDRYAMIVEDGIVKNLNREDPGKLEVSDADSILALL